MKYFPIVALPANCTLVRCYVQCRYTWACTYTVCMTHVRWCRMCSLPCVRFTLFKIQKKTINKYCSNQIETIINILNLEKNDFSIKMLYAQSCKLQRLFRAHSAYAAMNGHLCYTRKTINLLFDKCVDFPNHKTDTWILNCYIFIWKIQINKN